MENQENKQPEEQKPEESPKQKSVFTATTSAAQPKPTFNPLAKPFHPSRMYNYIGPSMLPVNAKVWNTIASNRSMPTYMASSSHQYQGMQGMNQTLPSTSSSMIPSGNSMQTSSPVNICLPRDAHDYPGYRYANHSNNPPAFDADPNRRLYFRREFGPVATDHGFIDIRLRKGINIFLTLDRAILVDNGPIRVAVSSDAKLSSLDHCNGRVRQISERVDLIAFDGFNKNDYIRYAKMWKDSISLTSQGCFLTYLVDPAGARTTSDQVNREWNKDYCKEAFYDDFVMRNQSEIDHAAAHYNYKVEEDGTETFIICGVKISQTRDGMVRVACTDHFSIRTSAENRSVTLATPNMYATASMSDSPHLFVRHNERRIHFDGANFIVRNMGHSASFDSQNLLRIH